jgi:hypothetical protein
MRAPSQTFFPNAFALMRSGHPCCRATLRKWRPVVGMPQKVCTAYCCIYDIYKRINILIIKNVCNVKIISDFHAWGRGRRASEGFSRDKSDCILCKRQKALFSQSSAAWGSALPRRTMRLKPIPNAAGKVFGSFAAYSSKIGAD